MNDLRQPPTRDALPRRPDELDVLLRRFFRSEMPDPWPAPPPVTEAPRRPLPAPRPWFRQSSRWALAAAVSFFLVGYLALSWVFPRGGEAGLTPGSSSPFGKGDGIK